MPHRRLKKGRANAASPDSANDRVIDGHFFLFFVPFLSLMLLAGIVMANEPETLGGQYYGVGASDGMTLELRNRNGSYSGTLILGSGVEFLLKGRVIGNDVQGTMSSEIGDTFFHFEARPLGLQILLIPPASDGTPDIDAASEYSLLREGVSIPRKGAAFETPKTRTMSLPSFIENFRRWSPRDVADVYARLVERDRALIQLFDHATAEILWRVCLADPPTSQLDQSKLDSLLRRQETNCADYLELVRAAESSGLLGEFIQKARLQFELLRETALCNRGEKTEQHCLEVSAARGPMMVTWRQAPAIMIDLAEAGIARPVEPNIAGTDATGKPLTPPSGNGSLASRRIADTGLRPSFSEIAEENHQTSLRYMPRARPVSVPPFSDASGNQTD